MVIAMGDSITAGFAARGTLKEGRDISWSVGVGAADQMTLPWLMNQYRGAQKPKLQGASTKAVIPNHVFNLPHGDYHPDSDFLNVAESSGAVHRNSMVEQWGLLETALKRYPGHDQSWKVMTIWMTANDVCGAGHECNHAVSKHYLADWVAGHDAVLTNVSLTMKRVYVNLVSTLDLSNVARIQRKHAFCKVEHQHILRECGCIDRGNQTQLAQLDANIATMNAALHGLAARWTEKLGSQNRTDMAVTVQAFQEGVGKQLDDSFLNNLDCFHPSTRGHEDLAVGLWNNMLCTGDRSSKVLCGHPFSPDMTPVCPTQTSRFYVAKPTSNS